MKNAIMMSASTITPIPTPRPAAPPVERPDDEDEDAEDAEEDEEGEVAEEEEEVADAAVLEVEVVGLAPISKSAFSLLHSLMNTVYIPLVTVLVALPLLIGNKSYTGPPPTGYCTRLADTFPCPSLLGSSI